MAKAKNKTHSFTQPLFCGLTAIELGARSKELATKYQELHELNEDLRAYSKNIKAQISNCEARIGLLSRIVETEREQRPVECETVYDFTAGEKRTLRKDTGEVIKAEPISDGERQESLV